ncbi:alpha/beta fold hydrolase [Dietzia alimentaria]|uniref:alpha/beta fold hydrolase n=1 Tax=Dietzia alimentaria TaxID=665550 RepID=UPI001145EC81|nr:alpha/beta fold hydrolase [Dietzia alimentaria]
MRPSPRSLLCGAVTIGVIVGNTPLASPAPSPSLTRAGVDTLSWSICPAESERDTGFGLPRADVLCASVHVPVHHDDPGGRTVGIEVRKITATGERTGTVFGNPGGPGGDARDMWYSALDGDDDAAIDEVRRDHDLVIVQPRGLEGAGALECLPEDGLEGENAPVLALRCMNTDREFVSTITTENLVRDHELVRQLMGLDRINYLGYSYGTAIGMMYQTLFPDSIERMVLDSAVGPTDTWWYELHLRQAQNRYQARNYVLEWIAEHDDAFELGDTPLEVYREIHQLDLSEGAAASRFLPPPAGPDDDLVGSLPVPSSSVGSVDGANTGSARLDNFAAASSGVFDRDVDGAVGYFMILDESSTSPAEWPAIAWAISAKVHGTLPDPPSPEALAAALAEESDQPAVTSDMETYLTILNCNETAPTVGTPLAPVLLGSSESVGSTHEEIWGLTEQVPYCLYPPSTVPHEIQANPMAARPLVIQADHDPQTPAIFGPSTAAATGGTLVRVRGTVHGQFDSGNEAVDEIVLRYLKTGQVEPDQHLDTPRPLPGTPPWARAE